MRSFINDHRDVSTDRLTEQIPDRCVSTNFFGGSGVTRNQEIEKGGLGDQSIECVDLWPGTLFPQGVSEFRLGVRKELSPKSAGRTRH